MPKFLIISSTIQTWVGIVVHSAIGSIPYQCHRFELLIAEELLPTVALLEPGKNKDKGFEEKLTLVFFKL